MLLFNRRGLPVTDTFCEKKLFVLYSLILIRQALIRRLNLNEKIYKL